MRFIQNIRLKNFKKFEDFNLSFSHRFTLLIGKNGSGKTAILEGIADSLLPLVYKWSDQYKPVIPLNNVHRKIIRLSSKANIEPQYPCEVGAIINTNRGGQIELPVLKRERERHYLEDSSSQMYWNYLKTIDTNVMTSEAILPLIGFYRTNRLWTNQKDKKETDLIKIGSRYDPYHTCLNPTANSHKLIEWFKRLTYISIQEKEIPFELAAVQNAIKTALSSIHNSNKEEVDVYFDVKSDELLIQLSTNNVFPLRLLSDGYRNTLGMIGDIAYRMAELNPYLTTRSYGIVLIDEIDLHLHPEWQKTIVGDLKKIFPNCQFVATTHSPFIIQSLSKEDELIRLEENTHQEMSDHFTEQSVEDIAEQIQEVENQ